MERDLHQILLLKERGGLASHWPAKSLFITACSAGEYDLRSLEAAIDEDCLRGHAIDAVITVGATMFWAGWQLAASACR